MTGKFEDELLHDLITTHGHLLHRSGERPARSRVRRRHGLRALVVVSAVAAVIVAVPMVVRPGAAAYAVEPHPDGTVTISLTNISALTPANEELGALGLRVRVVPMTSDCPVLQPDQLYPGQDWQLPVRHDDGSVTVGSVPPGYTVLLALATYPGGEGGLSFTGPVADPAPACLLSPVDDLERSPS